jgi:hypothetical protein
MKDNQQTNPNILITRHRSGRNQFRLAVELALSEKQSTSNSGGSASASAGGGGVVQDLIGGEIPPDRGGLCFSGDTLFGLVGSDVAFEILYNNRERYIGKFARSFDEEGQSVHGEILDVFRSTAYEYLEVTFLGGSIDKVKPQHRYFTETGYQEIRNLIGKYVVREDGHPLRVVNMKLKFSREGVAMYNATIDVYHNYTANGRRVSNAKNQNEF